MVSQHQSTSKSIQRSIIIASCLGIMVIGLVIACLCLIPYWADLRHDGERDLQFAFHSRNMAVEAYFSSISQVATQIASRTHVREKLTAYSQDQGMSKERLAQFISPVYQEALRSNAELTGITLLDYQGKLLLKLGPHNFAQPRSPSSPRQKAEMQGPRQIGDQTFITVSIPILSSQKIEVGLVSVTFQAKGLRRILEDSNGLGETGQTLLGYGGETATILFFPRRSGASNNKSCLAALTPFFRKACAGISGMEFLETRKEMVVFGPVAKTPWGMVIGVNQSEVYKNISNRVMLVVAVILGFIVSGVWLMAALLRPLTGKIIMHNEDLLQEINAKTAELQKELQRRRETESELRDSEDRLRSLTGQLIRTQENERRRIYRELHDELGQTLAACKIQLQSMEKNLPVSQRKNRLTCAKIEELLDGMMTSLRRLWHDLSPSILEELGLEAALRNLMGEMSVPGTLKVQVETIPLEGIFTLEEEINIYRIVQEALGNIGKHAHASMISLDIIKENSGITVSVHDDGNGFEPEEIKADQGDLGGMGLTFMRERARMLKGSLWIESRKGTGTRLVLHIHRDLGE